MVLDKLKQLKQMRAEALKMQRELAQEKLTVEEGGVKVIISGDQQIESLEINGEPQEQVVRVMNKAIKEAQKLAAQKLTQMSGGLSGLLP